MTFKYCFLFVYTGYLIIIDRLSSFEYFFIRIWFNIFITRVLFFARKKIPDISERKRGDWKKETRCYSLWMLDDGVSRLTWRSRKRGCRNRRGDSPSFLSDEASWRECIPHYNTLPFFHPLRLRCRHDPSLRYRQSSMRNEAREGKAEPSLCRRLATELPHQDNTVLFHTKYIYERV